MIQIPYGKAICYSGYRDGQSPVTKTFPTYEQVQEDLRILAQDFDYIRLYDSGPHAETVLQVLDNEPIALKVLLGMALQGEISNPHCAWGGMFTDQQILANTAYNNAELERAIDLGTRYKNHILAISVGNENAPTWNDRLVDPTRILHMVRSLKQSVSMPVTYCDNHACWHDALVDVAQEVDVISIHSYPVWVGTPVEHALGLTMHEFKLVQEKYPDKQVIITETGWPTRANGGQIQPQQASELHQRFFNKEMERWTTDNNIICFFFEAFDEPWKGSEDPNEPEKHWGYYTVSRRPKLITQN